ncbi:hypothetical protein GA0115250_138316 [Streptomyces sp. BvitLS-983]|nr:hypothetical protein GA0115250_138316 [Streptomyces sp. BvitLS-983]
MPGHLTEVAVGSAGTVPNRPTSMDPPTGRGRRSPVESRCPGWSSATRYGAPA